MLGHSDLTSASSTRLLPSSNEADTPEAMGWFWAALYSTALGDLDELPDTLIVSHAELASGSSIAMRRLFDALMLPWSSATQHEFRTDRSQAVSDSGTNLHNLSRPPSAVANAWRAHLSLGEIESIEKATAEVRGSLERGCP